MKNMSLLTLGLAFSLGLGACAGELTLDEQEQLYREHMAGAGGGTPTSTSSGSAGSSTGSAGSSTGSAGSTGSGGSTGTGGGSPVETCVTTSMQACQNNFCHGQNPAVGLVLDNDALTKNYKDLFVDKPNKGTDGITMEGDPNGCVPGMYKLIDSANPTNSLLYRKAFAPGDTGNAICGAKMPIIGSFSSDDKACMLKWINSVIAASK